MSGSKNSYSLRKARLKAHKVYDPSTAALQLHSELNRKIHSEDSEWMSMPESLSFLCLQKLTEVFKDDVLLKLPFMNYAEMLELLPTNLPLSVTAHLIPDGIYWRRCIISRWNSMQNVYNYSCSWKQLYFERHIKEYIETLYPENYNVDEVTEILSTCKPYVHKLSIRQLLPNHRFIKCEGKCEKNCVCVVPNAKEFFEHIDLKEFLIGLENLKELDISFGLQHCGTVYIRSFFGVSPKDCINIGIALALSKHVRIFRLHHTQLASQLAAVIIDSIKENTGSSFLQVLDFSYCKIDDEGARKISEFMHFLPHLGELILQSNRIGQRGGFALAAGLESSRVPVHVLNLSQNPVGDDALFHIFAVLASSEYIKELYFKGCKLTIASAWIVRSFLILNTSLNHLFLSNNCFGKEGGMQIFIGLILNDFVKALDINMSSASTEIEAATKNLLMHNALEVGTSVLTGSEDPFMRKLNA